MNKFKYFKIYVPTPAINEEVQHQLFRLGHYWVGGGKRAAHLTAKMLYSDGGQLTYGMSYDHLDTRQELSIGELFQLKPEDVIEQYTYPRYARRINGHSTNYKANSVYKVTEHGDVICEFGHKALHITNVGINGNRLFQAATKKEYEAQQIKLPVIGTYSGWFKMEKGRGYVVYGCKSISMLNLDLLYTNLTSVGVSMVSVNHCQIPTETIREIIDAYNKWRVLNNE